MTVGSDVLNAREAAEFLRAHVETVRRLARRGEIPSFKVGKDWRFSREALRRWSAEQPQPPSEQPKPPSASKPGLVLIVDDDEKLCRASSQAVERMGYRARYATSGAEGLRVVALETPDLILLDLMMPDMKGPRFLETLRETHPDLPVVIVTGYPDSDAMHQATHYAPLMLLAKPAETAQLERTIRIVLGQRPADPRTR